MISIQNLENEGPIMALENEGPIMAMGGVWVTYTDPLSGSDLIHVFPDIYIYLQVCL